MFVQDYILNGQGHGQVAEQLAGGWNSGLRRPYIANDANGRPRKYVDWETANGKFKRIPVDVLQSRGIHSPVFNASTLPLRAWQELDRKVLRATRQRLRAWADLSAANSRGGFNAMGKMTLEYQAMTDAGQVVVDMDGLTDGPTDRPLLNMKSVPLPITHSDFWFSEREIEVSRTSGMPLDTTMAEAAGRRVAEKIEKTLIGVDTGVTYGTVSVGPTAHTGTSTVYGYTNFPYRVTKTDLNTPAGTNPEAVNTDVLEMIETMQGNGFFGPYILYHSTGYSRFLNDDYFRSGSTSAVRSLRARIMENEGLMDIRRLDFLTSGYQLLLIQMSPDVAEAINGMDVTVLHWESQGGMRQNFKVMAIQVPLLKSPYNGIAGIIHATTA